MPRLHQQALTLCLACLFLFHSSLSSAVYYCILPSGGVSMQCTNKCVMSHLSDLVLLMMVSWPVQVKLLVTKL